MDLKKILTDNQYNPTVYLDQVTVKENSNTKEDSLIQYDEQWGDEELPFKPDEVVKGVPLVYSNFSPGFSTGCSPTTPFPRTSCNVPLASMIFQCLFTS